MVSEESVNSWRPRRSTLMSTAESASSSSSSICLPEDMWRLIFTKLDDSDLMSTSRVSKLFYSLSRPLVRKLVLTDPDLTYRHISTLLQRFPGTRKIRIGFPTIINNALIAISTSALNLDKLQLRVVVVVEYPTGLKEVHHRHHCLVPEPEHATSLLMSRSEVIRRVKSLELSWFGDDHNRTTIPTWLYCSCFRDLHSPAGGYALSNFTKLFPSVTELDLRCNGRLGDKHIHKVTLNHPNLQKINISGNKELTDMTLAILTSNCPKLERVNFLKCRFQVEALCDYFRKNRLLLRSVVMPPLDYYSRTSDKIESIKSLKYLNHVTLQSYMVHDEVLVALAESLPPLKSLCISNTPASSPSKYTYTLSGVSQLLVSATCVGLEKLTLHLPEGTHDAKMSRIIRKGRLRYLKHIKVTGGLVLCHSTLMSLVQYCPSLETIWVVTNGLSPRTSKKPPRDYGRLPTKKNYSIRSIIIEGRVADVKRLRMAIEASCPNLMDFKNVFPRYN